MMKPYLKIQILVLLFTTLSLCAQSYTALYRVTGTRDYVPIKVEITLPNNWEIRKSTDPTRADTLATKQKGIALGMEFSDLGHLDDKKYIQKMVGYGYTHSTVDNQNILTQEDEAYGGGKYLNVRMTLGEKSLYAPVFPPKGESLSSISTEISELTHILAGIKLSSSPDAISVKKVIEKKYDAIKHEIDTELAHTTLIDDEGKLKEVDSFCLSLNVIPFKYSQDKKAPQSLKDYANNAISMCKGKLYTSALTKHLATKGKASCSELKNAFTYDFFIKSALRESGDIKMWEKLQKQYKNTCSNK